MGKIEFGSVKLNEKVAILGGNLLGSYARSATNC
jgi:hypothetical protein